MVDCDTALLDIHGVPVPLLAEGAIMVCSDPAAKASAEQYK